MIRIPPTPHLAVDWLGHGPLVLFLHGVGGNRGSWQEQLPAFAARHTAVAWDARGYGDSDDGDDPLSFDMLCADVARVLDHFGADQAHLVGLSMGGRIALDFYGRHPNRVLSLTLADTSVARRGPEKIAQDTVEVAARKRPLLAGKTPAELAPALARRLAGPHVSAAALERIESSLAALRLPAYFQALDAIAAYEGYPDFAAVTVPCLVLGGEFDPLAPPELLDRMAAQMPRAERATVPGAGHLSNIENPAAFNQAVLAFLEGVA